MKSAQRFPNRRTQSTLESDELKSEWLQIAKRFLPLHPAASLWRYSRALGRSEPEEGWKIHLSATILTANGTLLSVGSFLRRIDAAFKAPATLDELLKINCGVWYGYSQVGKFITVYPRGNDEFKFLCKQLHKLTCELGTGPRIPFDNSYATASNVYYRYGAFQSRPPEIDNTGVTPLSLNETSRRDTGGHPFDPADPLASESRASRIQTSSCLSNRYQIFRALNQRGKGGVYEAIDIAARPPRRCIIKEGRRYGETQWDGRDGSDRIRNEASILSEFSLYLENMPAFYEVFYEEGNTYLVMEKVGGVVLQKLVDSLSEPLPIKVAMHLCRELVKFIEKLHRVGIVWRDCKPANLILEKSGRLRAIDFEGSSRIEVFDPYYWSTPIFSPSPGASGYQSGRKCSNLPEDLFALGATLYLLLENKMPFESPTSRRLIPMTRTGDTKIRNLVGLLLDSDPAERPMAGEVLNVLMRSRE